MITSALPGRSTGLIPSPPADAVTWPCGLDCRHASPVATSDDWLWCRRPAGPPAGRLLRPGGECRGFEPRTDG